jgi:subtilisin family serine protease
MAGQRSISLRSGPEPHQTDTLVESPSRFVVHYRARLPGPTAAKAMLKLPLSFGKQVHPVRLQQPGSFTLFDVKPDGGKTPGYDDLAGLRDATMNYVRSSIGEKTDAVACYHAYSRSADGRAKAETVADSDTEIFPSGKMFLEFHEAVPETFRREVLEHYALVVERALPYWPGAYIVRVTQQTGASPVNLAHELQALTFKAKNTDAHPFLFDWADPLFHRRRRFHSIPADGLFKFQWHLHNDGSQGGVPGADIRAPEAWDITRGHPSVRVAIIDDGFDINHRDIESGHRVVASLDANTGETDVLPTRDSDQWHGTSVLGLIAAAHNGRGCCGVAPDCSLIVVKLDALSDDEAEARAFDYAVDNGAHVINCSWGPYDDYSRTPWRLPRVVELAIYHAYQNHVPVVFAAGNGSEDIARDGYASCPHVIAVAASTDQNKRAYFSDYGSDVWVCAPSSGGVNSIVTTDLTDGGYNPLGGYSDGFGGTSAAAPLVTGVIALMQSAYVAKQGSNGRLSVTTIKDILKTTARKIDPKGADFQEYWDKKPISVQYNDGHSLAYGWGLVDAGKAVRAVVKAPAQGSAALPSDRWDGDGPQPPSVWHFDGLTHPLKPRMVQDPLSLFATTLKSTELSKSRFEGGEHVWLGSAGFQRALTENPRFAKEGLTYDSLKGISREDGKERFTYGEIVALSGDFYGTPGDLYWEKKSVLSFLWEENDLADLRKGFAKELDAIAQQQKGKVDYPDNNIAYWWNAKNYVELAKNNAVHFGWHNMVAYCRYHAQAIALAQAACRYKNNEPAKEQESWRQALFYNAFADHFLTDGFAAGHIRVPRQQIIDWAITKPEAGGKGWSLTVAGALSKLVHDQDGHITGQRHDQAHGQGSTSDDGLPVVNSNGERWAARCDGQLFIGHAAADPIIRCPVEAVKASVTELCDAYLFGREPKGLYAGTVLVPFPDPAHPKLVEKFPQNPDEPFLQRLYDGMQWYLKLPVWKGAHVEKGQIQEFLQALPALMQKFRDDVTADLKRIPELTTRLPASLIQAFQTIG